MTHIIKMFHRVTDDGAGVYLTCEENGIQRFASDMKKNGLFHPYGPGGAPMGVDSVWLYDAVTQQGKYSKKQEKASGRALVRLTQRKVLKPLGLVKFLLYL